MSQPLIIDLASEGKPNIHLQIAPEGTVSNLNVALPGDLTTDTFEAAVESNGETTSLNLVVTYDAGDDKTSLAITFPGSGIPSIGKFGIRWTTGQFIRWPVSGSYERKTLIP